MSRAYDAARGIGSCGTDFHLIAGKKKELGISDSSVPSFIDPNIIFCMPSEFMWAQSCNYGSMKGQ